MKKVIKWGLIALTVGILVGQTPYIQAESAGEVVAAAIQNIKFIDQLKTIHLNGSAHANIITNGINSDLLDAKVDVVADFDEPIQALLDMRLIYLMKPTYIKGVIKDYQVWGYYNNQLEVNQKVPRADIADVREQLISMATEVANVDLNPAQLALMDKYFSFEETGQTYHFALKKQIDSATLWADLSANFEMAELHQLLTAIYSQEIADYYVSENGVRDCLAAIQLYEFTWNKDLTPHDFTLEVSLPLPPELTAYLGEGFTSEAERILHFKSSGVFDGYHTPVQLSTPQDQIDGH